MSRVLPILFNTDMVRAILDGRKTVTRRLVKLPKYIQEQENGLYTLFSEGTCYENQHFEQIVDYLKKPYTPGDILYVRETFCPNYFDESIAGCRGDGLRGNRNAYKADYNKAVVGDVVPEPKWKPSIHMPKEAVRIWLKVTDVRVERLQEMKTEDFLSEGILGAEYDIETKNRFVKVWNSTLKKPDLDRYGWDANPWVWVIRFERCGKPKDWR